MKIKLYIIITLLFFGSSCDDVLDIEPQYTQDAESFFKTPEDYERALIAAYDLLQTSYVDVFIGEIASDNSIAGGESVNDSRGLHEIETMTHGGVNDELRSILRYNYAGIARVNYIFENQDNIEFDGKESILAQAAFLRAYYYFQLVKYFGDIPLIIDRRVSIDEVTNIARTPAEDVYAQIEQDLTFAASILDFNAAEKGRVTRGAALSLLGKVYLYQDKFAQAADALDVVIESNEYALHDDFSTLFSVANEESAETVFDIQYTGQEGGGYGCFVCLEGNAAVGFHGIRQYNGPVYADGNTYNLPTQDLYDAFAAEDPRRDATVLDLDAFIAQQPNASEITYAIGGGGHTGYYNNKYIKKRDELGLPDDDLTSPVNHKAIRYADVLLMAAEAHNRKNGSNDDLAREYLNLVRDRVDLAPITSSGQQLTQAIWNERRFELSGEGLRFFDLVRTGQAASEIDGFVTGTHEVFPIPQVEIDLAGGNWQQNSGY
jgi:hypothetical protein